MDAAILPVKSPARAKQRLFRQVTPEQHGAITAALLEDAFALCAATDFVSWFVVSDDPAVLDRAETLGLRAIQDSGEGLNSAVATAIGVVIGEDAESATVIPSDVPLAQPEDLQDIVDTGDLSDVVLVPATQDGGTNGLYLSPPDILAPAFGPNSTKAHAELARTKHLRCSILDLPGLAIDLDDLDDAKLLLDKSQGNASNTIAVLRDVLG